MSNNLHHVENLLRMVADKDATIDRQAAQLVEYAKMLDDERATVLVLRDNIVELRFVAQTLRLAKLEVLVLRDNIVELRTALDAVPLQEIMQFVHGAMYDPRANVDDYMPDDYDADRAVINAWLRKELSAE